MKRIALSVVFVLVFVQDYAGKSRVSLPARQTIRAVPVDLFPNEPSRRTLGDLTYLGGVELIEQGAATGGYSAIAVEGDRFELLSDEGNLLHFSLTLPATISGASMRPVPDGPGAGWEKRDRDAEAMAIDRATGTTWIAYENSNEIWRYGPGLKRATGHAAPRVMAPWTDNNGAETMVRLRDGSFIVIGETWRPPGGKPGSWHRPGAGRAAFRFAGDPVEGLDKGYAFAYVPPEGYDPVDAAELPDGRIVVLNRNFTVRDRGFTAKLTIFDAADIKPGARITGREIATLARPALYDNFEGVAVTREQGATILWLVSDDNQLPVQRTLLLKFRLNPPPRAAQRL